VQNKNPLIARFSLLAVAMLVQLFAVSFLFDANIKEFVDIDRWFFFISYSGVSLSFYRLLLYLSQSDCYHVYQRISML
jgi:hypothetical protein